MVPRRHALIALGLCAAFAACSPDAQTASPGDDAAADAGADGGDDAGLDDATDVDAGQPADGYRGRNPPCQTPADCPAPPGPCSAYACHAALGCVVVVLPAGSPCLDDAPCTVAASCQGQSCAPTATKDCDDGNPCTDDSCADGSGTCAHLPTAVTPLACDDGDGCTHGDACVAGACQGGQPSCACQSDADCKDKGKTKDGKPNLCAGSWYCAVQPEGGKACVQNPATIVACDTSADTACTFNTCSPDTGLCAPKTTKDGGACDDDDPCSAGETCLKGACQGGAAICCQADVDCKAAEDGNVCNGSLFCNKASGKCQLNPATVVSCPSVDDTACAKAACEPKTGTCKAKWTSDGEACDDGNPCTPGELCKAGLCSATTTNTCPCKVDADCGDKDDGDPCNGTPYCDVKSGTCETNPATVVVCATVDDTTCAHNVCAGKTGKCAMTPAFDGTACDGDGNPCTPNDACKAGSCVIDTVNTCVCSANADCAAQDDGDICNGSLFCDKTATGAGSTGQGSCKVNPATIPSCPSVDNTACVKSICQAKTGKCAMTFVNQGEICDDGDPCTKGDVCDNGGCKSGGDICLCKQDSDCLAKEDKDVCNGTLYCDKSLLPWACAVKPSTVIVCPTVNDSTCQQSICQKPTGLCVLTPLHNDEPCDDGDTCTVNTVCKGGLCSDPFAATGGKCNDGNPCTDDACDKAVGCTYKPHVGSCEDGDKCTEGDSCKDKTCLAGKPATCDDGNACTTNLCNAQVGCVAIQNADACSDGDACTVGDTCKAGGCVIGAAKDCSDSDPCSADACDSKSGACSHDASVDQAVHCDDSVPCTIDTCNALSGCIHSPAQGFCDDKVACTLDTCHTVFGCSHFADSAACSDGDSCTLDTCVAAVGCKHSAAANASACSDGDVCTVGDSCKAGKCSPGTAIPGCKVDPKQCQGKADGTACNDGDACSKGEACLQGVCAPPLMLTTAETLVSSATVGVVDGVRRVATAGSIVALARLPSGALAFASTNIPALRVLGTDGRVATLAGRHVPLGDDAFTPGQGSAATLGDISGLDATADGTLLGADSKFHVIFSVSAGGAVALRAGSGVTGHKDGKGAAAQFETPLGVALAPDGNLFVCDRGNAVIRRVTPDGTVTTVSGVADAIGGDDGKASARWYWPESIARAPDGSFLVVDRVGQTLRRLGTDGTVTTLVGAYGQAGLTDGKGAEARLYGPSDVDVDAAGVIWIAEYEGHAVRRVTPGLQTTVMIGSLGAGTVDGEAAKAKVNGPYRLALDAFGDLVVGEYAGANLRRLRLRADSCDDGKLCTRDDCDPATGACTAPAIDCDDGALCTSDSCSGETGTCSHSQAVDGSPCDDGDVCTLAGLCGAGHCLAAAAVKTLSGAQGSDDGDWSKAGFYGLAGLRAAADGRIVVADSAAHRLRLISKGGVVSTLIGVTGQPGSADGPAGVARLQAPRGAEFGLDGALIVADTGNHKVRRVTLQGEASTIAGLGEKGSTEGPVAVARFADPYDVVLDANGAILVADTNNHRIRKIAGGVVSTLAGSGYGLRDGPSAIARFHTPTALARSHDGVVYVADHGNASVRRVDLQGLVTTVAGGGRDEWRMGRGLEAALKGAHGVAVDRLGNVWVASSIGRVAIIDRDGTAHHVAGGAGGGGDGVGYHGSLGVLVAIAVLPDGRALVADATLDRLRTIQPALAACDDGSGCTHDLCAAKVGCVHTPNAAPCDDGDPCTSADTCGAGACKPGSKVAGCTCKAVPGQGCDDKNPCTIDTCDPKTGCAASKVQEGACDDGDPCTGVTTCVVGNCEPPASVVAVSHGAGVDSPALDCCPGGRDGSAAQLDGAAVGRLNQPYDLAAGPDGSVYIADLGNHAVRRLTADGRLETVAGAIGQQGGHLDGTASAARFHHPWGVALDLLGGVYVSEVSGAVIRRIGADGAVTTVAGKYGDAAMADGKGAAARLSGPRGLGADPAGNILIADTGNHRLRSLGLDGQVKTLAGGQGAGLIDGPALSAALNGPEDVAADSLGTIYITDGGNAAIRRLDKAGVVTTVLASGSASAPLAGAGMRGSKIGYAAAIAISPAGVAFADQTLGVVRMLLPSGGTALLAGGGDGGFGPGSSTKMSGAYGIVALADGSWLVGMVGAARLRRLRPIGASCDDGNACTLDVCDKTKGCAHPAATPAQVCSDGSPCQQPTCDVTIGRCAYQARADGTPCGGSGDCVSQCRRGVCAAAALVSHTVGNPGDGGIDGPAQVAQLYAPMDVVGLPNGKRYVLEYNPARIREVAADGAVKLLCGNGAGYKEGKGADAQFHTPHALTHDGAGGLLVADTGNARLRKVDAAGNVSTLAGSGQTTGVDGPATLASFTLPVDVAATASTVWVSDQGLHAIRRLKDGKLTTVAGQPLKAAWFDGPLGTNALHSPAGIAVDGKGALWIADSGSYTIRRLGTDGHLVTALGDPGNPGPATDGRGWRAATTVSPLRIVALADGTLVWSEASTRSLRRGWPFVRTETIAGAETESGVLDGVGVHAQLGIAVGLGLDAAGQIWVAQPTENRVRRLSVGLQGCDTVQGAAPATAGLSCAALAASLQVSGLKQVWIDPTPTDSAPPFLTTCDLQTAGGGWTRVDPTVEAADVSALLAGKGQVLYKCAESATAGVVSPPFSGKWSWQGKIAQPGTWQVAGVNVSCGSDASFGTLSCGFGVGCASAGEDAPALLPGVGGPGQCAGPSTIYATGPMALCDAKAAHDGWVIYVR